MVNRFAIKVAKFKLGISFQLEITDGQFIDFMSWDVTVEEQLPSHRKIMSSDPSRKHLPFILVSVSSPVEQKNPEFQGYEFRSLAAL